MDSRICFVSYNIPPDYSGAGRRAWKQAKFLAEKGMKVLFITASDNREVVPNLKVVRIKMPFNYMEDNYRGVLRRQLYNPILFFKALPSLISHKVKLIHAIPAFSWLTFNVALAGKLLGAKVIIETTLDGGDDPVTLRNSNLGWLKFKIYRVTDIVVNISPLLVERCREAGVPDSKAHLIPNSIDTEKFSPPSAKEKDYLRNKLGLTGWDHIFIFVGIMRERKRVAELIDAFKQVWGQGINCYLVLAGPFDKDEANRQYYRQLLEQVSRDNLDEYVCFTGEVDNIEEWLKASDTFLFASEREGLPNAVIEAASCGLPVVAMDIPGTMEYIFDQGSTSGIITDNFEQFGAEMARLARDNDHYRRISTNARKRAVNFFSDQVVMDAYRELYRELTG